MRVLGPGGTGSGEKDQNVDYHSHDETHECDQMLNDKNFVTQISDRSNGADCYPEKNWAVQELTSGYANALEHIPYRSLYESYSRVKSRKMLNLISLAV
jgi:hypothetical protein